MSGGLTPTASLENHKLGLKTTFQVVTCEPALVLEACSHPQDRLCGGHTKTQMYTREQAGPHVATHLPSCCLEPILLTDGDKLFPVQVAIPGDAKVLTDLLQFLLYPVRAGQ